MKNKYKPWTETENSYLRRVYPKHGPHYCAQKLGRTIEATRKQANDLTLNSGIIANHIPLNWIAPRNNQGHILRSALKQAQRDGVLKHTPNRRTKYTVPTWWADQYLQQQDNNHTRDQQTHNWLTLHQIAITSKIKTTTLAKQIQNNTKLGKLLNKHVETYKQTHKQGQPILYHPQQTQHALNIWRSKQHK